MNTIKLINGLEVPAIGSGTNTFAKTNGIYDGHTDEIVSAIQAGYRFFDTAESYGNEEAVGNGIIESGIERKNFIVSTKMRTKFPGQDDISHSPLDAEKAIQKSLSLLKTDYIDIYLIHMPWGKPEEIPGVWSVLEDYYNTGTLKAIGVSNFTVSDLEKLIPYCRIKPMINQIRIAPGNANAEAVAYSQANGIIPIAWGPLRGIEDTSVFSQIGKKYNKTWSQVVLRRNYQKGIISIPKSHSFEHQKENLDIFDFELTDAEMIF